MHETAPVTRDALVAAASVVSHAQTARRVVFFGTGKQASNIVLCIRKQLESASHFFDMEFVGIGCRDQAQDRFAQRLAQLFPMSRHTLAAHTDRYASMDDQSSIGFVASPPHAHEAGLHWMLDHGVERIVIEKPIASRHRDLEAIGEILRTQPDRVCVQEQYLYSRSYLELLEIVRDPTAYVAERSRLPVRGTLSIAGTATQFFKRRVKDLSDKRHAENICLLELPHILTLLYNSFGQQSVVSLDVDDLLYRSRIYAGYKKASVVFSDRSSRRHQVDLSNVDPCKRVMNVQLSDGYNVELAFPGRLRHDSTVFETRVTITRGREKLHSQTYPDDHLATAIRHYLRWKGIVGTYESCYEPSRMVIDLAGA